MFDRLGRYVVLRGGEEEKDLETEKVQSQNTSRDRTRSLVYRIYFLLLHFILFFLVAVYFQSLNQERNAHAAKLLPFELPFAEAVVRYEEVTFDPTGFRKDSTQVNIYEGEPTPESDAAWSRLIDVGMYSLTKEEYDSLPLETIQTPGKPDQYLVTIEMFHQLHCVNYLRRQAYRTGPAQESHHSKKMHLNHCVDYLRQVLMCHGDLALITLERDDMRIPPVMPNFNIRHTCRNFDSIWEFAARRNISGIPIE